MLLAIQLAECFKRQWEYIEVAAKEVGCEDRLHIWPDPELKSYVDQEKLACWLSKPTVEKWDNPIAKKTKANSTQATSKNSKMTIEVKKVA